MHGYCDYCAKKVRLDTSDGLTCCSLCGKVVAEDYLTEEATFVKSSDGQARLAGNLVRSVKESYSESTERTLNEAYYGIESIVTALDIDGGEDIANGALKLYRMVLEKNRTRGRRKEQVQAACLYIYCRVRSKPYLLIDFSEHLRINVYVLGAVFLQLCKILSLEETQLFQKLVDPSLFIHRFADRLFKGKNQYVSKTALQIIASMKRDWMQTGRKPSGLCGAALYISALAHGFNCSKAEIIKAVHICEATLTKRLIEFENTESGGLTIEEFEEKSKEFDVLANMFGEDESQINSLNTGQKESRSGELLCKHKGAGIPQFAYGLCKDCYKDFMILSGGLNGGSEPPAFQRAERERIMAKEAAAGTNSQHLNFVEESNIKDTNQNDVLQSTCPDSTGATLQSNTRNDTITDKTDASDFTMEESESLSDIDDTEVDVYINTEEEKNLKTTVWEELNREYLEEQAEKEAAALAAKKAFEANFANCSEDVESVRQFAAAAAATAAQNRKEKRQKRAAELKNLGPPSTAGEAAARALYKKVGSRISHEVLKNLIDSEEEVPKRRKTQVAAGEPELTEAEAEEPELTEVEEAEEREVDDGMFDIF